MILNKGLEVKMNKKEDVASFDELDTSTELETIFNNALVFIVVLRHGRTIYKINQTFLDTFGGTSEDWVGQSIRKMHLSDEKFAEFGQKFYNSLVFQQLIEVDYQVKDKFDNPIWLAISGRAIDRNVPANLDKGVIWVGRDISKRKSMEEQLLRMSRIDELTGLHNRRYFFEIFSREVDIIKRYDRKLSLLMVDLDHFKNINDTYGHKAGDDALCLFADVSRKVFRKSDIIGRLGGEEFAVLLLDSDINQALETSQRFQNTLKHEIDTIANAISMTCSIGVVQVNPLESIDDAIAHADGLLYKAKANGRNRIEI